MDTKEKESLAALQDSVLKKDFKSAARENQRMVKYYESLPDTKDIISSNYNQKTDIISDLLAQILDDEEKKLALYGRILLHEEEIKTLTLTTGSLKKKVNDQQKKLKDMAALLERIKTLENEKTLLQKQIDQLKEIDLNPDKITGNPGLSGPKYPLGKVIPAMNNTL